MLMRAYVYGRQQKMAAIQHALQEMGCSMSVVVQQIYNVTDLCNGGQLRKLSAAQSACASRESTTAATVWLNPPQPLLSPSPPVAGKIRLPCLTLLYKRVVFWCGLSAVLLYAIDGRIYCLRCCVEPQKDEFRNIYVLRH